MRNASFSASTPGDDWPPWRVPGAWVYTPPLCPNPPVPCLSVRDDSPRHLRSSLARSHYLPLRKPQGAQLPRPMPRPFKDAFSYPSWPGFDPPSYLLSPCWLVGRPDSPDASCLPQPLFIRPCAPQSPNPYQHFQPNQPACLLWATFKYTWGHHCAWQSAVLFVEMNEWLLYPQQEKYLAIHTFTQDSTSEYRRVCLSHPLSSFTSHLTKYISICLLIGYLSLFLSPPTDPGILF